MLWNDFWAVAAEATKVIAQDYMKLVQQINVEDALILLDNENEE